MALCDELSEDGLCNITNCTCECHGDILKCRYDISAYESIEDKDENRSRKKHYERDRDLE